MSSHLRYAGLPHDAQRDELERIIRSAPLLMEVLTGLRDDGLPDHLLVAGAIYNLVWNRLTGRPDLTGINDIDVFYYDASDLSWDAEDVVIQRLARRFSHLPLPAQVRVVGIRHGINGLDLEFEPANARPTAVYRLEVARDAASPWTVVDVTTVEEFDSGGRRVFRLPVWNEKTGLFRVTIE